MGAAQWLIWAVLLVGQNASHTWTSRARNSKNLRYNLTASIFSNGIWFCSQFFIVNALIRSVSHPLLFVFTLVFYVVFTATGSVVMQAVLLRWERKNNVQR